MENIIIDGISMPKTRTLQVGGEYVSKEKTMASGKMVRDILGWRMTISASWDWVPAETLAQLVQTARSGNFLTIQYPDSTGQDASGSFSVSIGNQRVFRFLDGAPYWYSVTLTATAQEVTEDATSSGNL